MEVRPPGTIERTAIRHIGKLPRIFLYGPVALIIAWLLTPSGRSELQLKSVGVVILALWLAIDLWHVLLPKKWKWRFVVGWAGTSAFFILSMCAMWWWLAEELKDQQEDVYQHLVVNMYLPNNGNVYQSIVETVNNGAIDISNQIICHIYRIHPKEGMTINGGGGPGPGIATQGIGGPIKAGSRGQSIPCLDVVHGLKVQELSCADIGIEADYILDTQPDIKRTKPFRFVSRGDRWYPEDPDQKTSYCPAS